MARKQKSLGELELAVLKVVWEQPGSTVHEVAEVMGKQRDCAGTTVVTAMQRLHARRFLKQRKLKRVYQYSLTKERRTAISHLTEQFEVKELSPGLNHLLESAARWRGTQRHISFPATFLRFAAL